MDISRSEQVETDLDRLIEKRHDQRMTEEGHRPSEELWEASVRLYNARLNRERREEWIAFYLAQAAAAEHNGQIIAAENRAKAHRLMQDEPERAA